MKKKLRTIIAVLFSAIMITACSNGNPQASGPIGSKGPNEAKEPWDIVFTDGSATPFAEGMSLTQTQIENAVGIVFTANGNTLIAGIPCAGLAWCTSSSNLKEEAAASLYGTSYTNGFEGKDRLKASLQASDKEDDTGVSGHYPAWEYCWNYSKGIYSSGWYLPTTSETAAIITSNNKVKYLAVCAALNKVISDATPIFWTSSTGLNGNNAYGISFAKTQAFYRYSEYIAFPVYNLTAAQSFKKYKVTIHNYTEAVPVKEYTVFSEGKFNLKSVTEGLKYNADGGKYICKISTAADESGTTYRAAETITVTTDIDLYFHWYYGDNHPSVKTKAVGDIVFDDGSFCKSTKESFTIEQKAHAVGVVFYSDEENQNSDGAYYNGVTFNGNKIVLSKYVLPCTSSAAYTGGTRIINKKINSSTGTINFYNKTGPSTVTCRGNPEVPNTGINAYLMGSAKLFTPGENILIDEFNNAMYSGNQKQYSLVDGSLAQNLSQGQLGIYNNMPDGYYVPSITELQIIFYYRELISAQMKKIGSDFQLSIGSGYGISYWSCNTVPDSDNVYRLEIKDGAHDKYSSTPLEAVKTCAMSSKNRLLYCKKLD